MVFEKLLSDPLSLSSYAFLLLSIASLWITRSRAVWAAAFAIALALGLLAGRVEALAIVPIALLAVCFHVAQQGRYPVVLRVGGGTTGALLSIALAMHVVPGFDNWKILDGFALSDNAQAFSLYLNFDKPLVGLFILALGAPLLRGADAWKTMLREAAPIALTGIALVYAAGYAFGYATFDPTFSSVFIVWALRNLFFTCVAEEAFFRGFLQYRLEKALASYRWGKPVSLAIAALLFGLAHFAGGPGYVVLATIAGLVYGYVFQRTGRVEASILTHFLLNAGHFLLFTYPAAL
ncbi:MAG: CPBP family intramembrane glutamic endopeptidase [Pseudomonadota bacterium]